jgi:putative tricarboxylic transport membrane protein
MDPLLINITIMMAGIVMGLLAGMLPGIGNVVSLILVYPFITDFDLFQIVLFYMCLAGASQYTGSVVATTLAIPGETSSLPAVTEGHRMFLDGRGNYAISNSAIGSFVGAGIASLIMLTFLPVGVYAISKFYNTHVQSVILIGVAIFLVMTYAGQKWTHNLVLFALGWFLSSIGFSKQLQQYNWDFMIDYEKFYYLHFGLPLYPVVVSLFVFPIFIKEWNSPRPNSSALAGLWDSRFIQHLREFANNIGSALRGTLIGSLCGLVPHMTATLASNVAYIREMALGKKKGTYNKKGDIKSLVSAETANNAAGLTQLTPLLLIGIPITTSEAIVLNIIENNMQVINWETTVATGMFGKLVVYFVVMNALCLLAAWPFAKHLHVLFRINQKLLYTLTFLVLMVLVFYMGSMVSQQMYYVWVTLALLPLGYLLKRWDTLILVFAFVLEGQIQGAVIRLTEIYSHWLGSLPIIGSL